MAWAWAAADRNVRAPVAIDARQAIWGVEDEAPFAAMVSLNMIHIAPWGSALGLLAGAGRLLRPDGILYLYGPFMRAGAHTAPSNAAFDADLKRRNPSWGVRDIDDIVRGGQTANPSTGELLRIARLAKSREVLMLPNNPNVRLAAEQAARICEDRHLVVVPTRNAAEGIAALHAAAKADSGLRDAAAGCTGRPASSASSHPSATQQSSSTNAMTSDVDIATARLRAAETPTVSERTNVSRGSPMDAASTERCVSSPVLWSITRIWRPGQSCARTERIASSIIQARFRVGMATVTVK